MSKLKTLSVKRIDHVAIVVANLEATRYFYEKVLGMTVTTRPNVGFDGLWLAAGNTYIHVIVKHDESGEPGMPSFTGTRESRGHHISFVVEDATIALEQFKKFNIPLCSGPHQRADGATQLFVYDPDNYIIEIYSE